MKTIIICCVLLVCVSTGLLAQQSPTPSGHPLTVLNGSGDGRYVAGEIVPIAGGGAADGFTFLGWIVLTLNGRVTSWNEQSQFVMPNHASTVAAVYGKVETWFPPGDEQVKTGLLLPKGSEDPQHRSQQKVRVTFSLGDAAGRLKPHHLWSISRVLVDWFPKPEVRGTWGATEVIRCFDKEVMGEEIGRNQAIPKNAFVEVTQGVFEASVWHESLWTWQQAADKFDDDEEVLAPQLDVRVDLGVSSTQSYFISRSKIAGALLPIEIKPDDGVAGVVGDMVPSTKGATGEKHFVSPKKSADIPDDYVTLKAEGPTKELFESLLEWESGEAVPNEPLKRRVKRDATGKTAVKVKVKNGGQEAAKVNVWVVWASGQKSADRPIQIGATSIQTGDGTTGPGIVIDGGYDFKFTISPASIITDDDHPDLTGPNSHKGATVDPPGAGTLHFVFATDLKGGAGFKWDVSRRIRAKVLNPHLYGKDKLDVVPGVLWNNQPITSDLPVSFPSNELIGNDDTTPGDEENNPYAASSKSHNAHAIGEITSTDAPNHLLRHSTGSDGHTFELRYHFGEFARVLIANRWYRCSDFFDWRAHFKLKRQAGSWVNDGSSVALDNNGF